MSAAPLVVSRLLSWISSRLRAVGNVGEPLGHPPREIGQFLGIGGRSIATQVIRLVANRGQPVFRDHHGDAGTVTLTRPEEEKICRSIIVFERVVPTVETKRLKLSGKYVTDANRIMLVEFVRPRHQ